MPGPPPKPTHLKQVTGNPGKRPLNKREPKPVGNLFEPPTWMSESQKAGWTYAIANAPAGLLKRLDRGVMTIWVVAEDLHRTASEQLQAGNLVLKTATKTKSIQGGGTETTGGNIIQNPYIGIMNRQAQVMLKAASELGFTPASRSRIEIDYGDPEEGDEDDEMFG